MSFFKLEIEGHNRVRNGLRASASRMPKTTEAVIIQWAQKTRSVLKSTKYPPKRPFQKYKRTGRLANSWRVDKNPGGAAIVNFAALKGNNYARYVIGDYQGSGQAWMHEGRWWKAREVIDGNVGTLPKDIGRAIILEIEKETSS